MFKFTLSSLSIAALSLSSISAIADTIISKDAVGSVINSEMQIGGSKYNVDWYLPNATATGLVTVQHGFSRGCGNMRDTSKRIMSNGLMVLCVNANMSGGNPGLAEALATTLIQGSVLTPDGRVIPHRIAVGGHSAGGHFASRLGWKIHQLAPARLAGAVLFDPVAADGFTDNLMGISQNGSRPVHAITSNGGICNSFNNAYGALRQVRSFATSNGKDGFVGLQLTKSSTHVDSEGNNTNLIGYTACLQAYPKAENTAYLRDLSAQWSFDMIHNVRNPAAYPGGSYVNTLISNSRASLIQ